MNSAQSKAYINKFYKNILKEDSFIIDGNYSSSLEIRFEKADTIFFLDMPTELCLASEKQRRGKKREDLRYIKSSLFFINYYVSIFRHLSPEQA